MCLRLSEQFVHAPLYGSVVVPSFGETVFPLGAVAPQTANNFTCSEGIKMFVLDGLIAVNRTEGGFLYKLTAAGRKYIGTLESDYKEQYLAIAETVHKKYSRKSDSAILKEISGKAVQSLRR